MIFRQLKYSFWTFPIVGIIVGIVYTFMFIHGLITTWHFIGKPSENISRIIGIVGGHNLFVETEKGNIYSFQYDNYTVRKDFPSIPTQWKKEDNDQLEPDLKPIFNMKFLSWPLLVKVKQSYEMPRQLIEGEYLVKFALAEDGNLWMWGYGQGGMAVLTYFIFPVIGLFYGSLLALLVRAGIFVWKK